MGWGRGTLPGDSVQRSREGTHVTSKVKGAYGIGQRKIEGKDPLKGDWFRADQVKARPKYCRGKVERLTEKVRKQKKKYVLGVHSWQGRDR